MDRERKLQSFFIRFLLAGAACLVFAAMRLIPFCGEIVEKIFNYVTSDIVFFS